MANPTLDKLVSQIKLVVDEMPWQIRVEIDEGSAECRVKVRNELRGKVTVPRIGPDEIRKYVRANPPPNYNVSGILRTLDVSTQYFILTRNPD